MYNDSIYLLDDNRYTIRKNIHTLFDASKKVGLEENTEKTVSSPKCRAKS
jgi:hypothetical protein